MCNSESFHFFPSTEHIFEVASHLARSWKPVSCAIAGIQTCYCRKITYECVHRYGKGVSGRDLAINRFWSKILDLSIIFLMLTWSRVASKKCICLKNRMEEIVLQHLPLYAKKDNKEIQLPITDLYSPIFCRLNVINIRLCFCRYEPVSQILTVFLIINSWYWNFILDMEEHELF